MTRVDKAQRLLSQDRVTELDPPRVFLIEGDHDTYRVIVGPGLFRWCECPYQGPGVCSHLLAANNFITQEKYASDPLNGIPTASNPTGRRT